MIHKETEKQPIFIDSPEAVTPVIITAYQSAPGRIFLDEQSARYHSRTHVNCTRHGVVKGSSCIMCFDNRRTELWQKAERKEWDGNTMLYSESSERYFRDENDILEYLEEYEIPNCKNMMFYLCEPVTFTEVTEERIYSDMSPDDDLDLPRDIVDALKTLNDLIDKHNAEGTTGIWKPTKYAVEVELTYEECNYCQIYYQPGHPSEKDTLYCTNWFAEALSEPEGTENGIYFHLNGLYVIWKSSGIIEINPGDYVVRAEDQSLSVVTKQTFESQWK